jgi:hypothetical protein
MGAFGVDEPFEDRTNRTQAILAALCDNLRVAVDSRCVFKRPSSQAFAGASSARSSPANCR